MPGGSDGVTIVPPTAPTATNLTSGALLVVGDTLTLVGNELATVGKALPPGIGSVVTLASGVPIQAGEALQNSNRGLAPTLNGVLAASLSPLQSSNTLLTPAASSGGERPALLADSVALVSPRLQQVLMGGLTGVTKGAANTLSALTPLLANGAPTTLLAPTPAGTSSTVSAGMPVTGVPLASMPTTGSGMANSAMTGTSMTGASMTGASITGARVMTAPAMTATPAATAAGPISTVTAPLSPALKGVGTLVGGVTSQTINTVTGILGRH